MPFWSRFFSRPKTGGSSSLFPLPDNRFREMLQSVEALELSTRLPDLAGQTAIEIAPHLKPLSHLLKNRGASLIADIGTLEGASFRSRWDNLPLRSASCNFALCRTQWIKREFPSLIKEVARILKPGGKMVLIDLHPFSAMIQEGVRKNPVIEGGIPPGFERYFRMFQPEGLAIEAVREVFFDSSLKKFFGETEKGLYEPLRKTPFLIMLMLGKEES